MRFDLELPSSRSEYSRKWYIQNRQKKLEQSRLNYQKNREKRLKQTSEYQKHRPEVWRRASRKYQSNNRAKCRERNRDWYRRNAETERARAAKKSKVYYEQNKERIRQQQKTWPKNHPGAKSAHSQKRRAIKRGVTVNPNCIQMWMERVKSNPFSVCYYCGSLVSTKHIHFEHITPLTKGGSHSVENLCVSCKLCNLRKGTKLISEWKKEGQQILL